jgi:hypothetical protein
VAQRSTARRCFAELEHEGELLRVVEEDDLSRAVDDLVRQGQIVLGEQSAQTASASAWVGVRMDAS